MATGRARAPARAQHLRRPGPRRHAGGGARRCDPARTVRQRHAPRRAGAGARRRQQPVVRRRSARGGAGAGRPGHPHPGRRRRRRAGARRSRGRVARVRAVDPGPWAGRAGEPGPDPRHGRCRADPEHRGLWCGGTRTHPRGGSVQPYFPFDRAAARGGLRLRLPRQPFQARTRPLDRHRGGVPAPAHARAAAGLRGHRRRAGAGGHHLPHGIPGG